MNRIIKEEELRVAAQCQRSKELSELSQQLFALHNKANRQEAGLAFEKILNRLFHLTNLAPREPFRVVGEQIDGSFELDYGTYIIEAKWEKRLLPEANLLVFRGKIDGKSPYTRGIFMALNGITAEAKETITYGKQPTFFIIDGYDIALVLSEQVALVDLLRQKRRLLAEEDLVFVPYAELWTGSRLR
jgi:hypothetical protein